MRMNMIIKTKTVRIDYYCDEMTMCFRGCETARSET